MNLIKIAEDAFSSYKLGTSSVKSPKPLTDAWEHYKNSIDVSHGPEHIKSVLNYAQLIGKELSLDPADIEYAAVLHDIAREADVVHGTNDHELAGVNMAREYICHLPQNKQNAILDAIRNHRSTTGTPSSDLARVISDSDRLSSIDKLPSRSLDYYENVKGMPHDKALFQSYWNLRHRKLKRLKSGRDFHTQRGAAIYADKVKELERLTSTFNDYMKLLNKKN